MFAQAHSGAVVGLEATSVDVQCDISSGLPAFTIVGLPEKEVQESRERIRSAIKNSDYAFPTKKITANLAPADVKKEGVGLDLPLALAILVASEQLPESSLQRILVFGELSLDGELRPVDGALPVALHAAENDAIDGLLVADGNAEEAALVNDVDVYGVQTLDEAIRFLNGELQLQPRTFDFERYFQRHESYHVDLSEIRGQAQAKRALEIAAAGGHNVLMIGPPGSGKSMLAKRLPTIMPPLEFDEAVDVTRIHSIMGLLTPDEPLIVRRPFRAPHHTVSYAGMVGGGHGVPRPGEISLSQHGVLFLDELPEFDRTVLETLRQPLEEHQITLSRASTAVTFPARLTLVTAMNPCPCGHSGDPEKPCRCRSIDIERYRKRISGPFLDRMDLFVEVPRLTRDELMGKPTGEASASIRERVVRAHASQRERFQGTSTHLNAHMGVSELREHCLLSDEGRTLLERAIDRYHLSARAYNRVLKVSRTIADLEGSARIEPAHVAEAIQYRSSLESIEGGV